MISINFLIDVLFVTNIYVFLYNLVLSALNLLYQPVLHIAFYDGQASPEPFEIPLYLGLTFAIVLTLYFFHHYFLKKFSVPTALFTLINPKIKKGGLILILFLLLFLLYSTLGLYPFKGEPSQYPMRTDNNFSLIFFIAYVALISFITFQLTFLNQMLKKNRKTFFIGLVIIVAVIAIFIFQPGFPVNGYDYSFFYGPIWEIAHGKTILTDVPSQYGILPILFFAFLIKYGLIHFSSLPVFFWVLFLIEYFLIFYILYKFSRSVLLSLMALFSVITINYYSIFHIPLYTPQTGPLRWLPLFIVAALFFKTKKIDSKLVIFLVSVSAFWFIDSGIYVVLAYMTTLFLFLIKRIINFKNVFITSCRLIAYFISIIIFLEVVHFVAGYHLINFMIMFNSIHEYAIVGYGMIKMPPQSYFWLLPFLYFASTLYFLKKNNPDIKDQLLLFSAQLLLYGGIYFVGRSHMHNLFWLAPLGIFTFFIFASIVYANVKPIQMKFLFMTVIFLTFIVFPAYNRKENITDRVINTYNELAQGNIFQSGLDQSLERKYRAEKKLITQNLLEPEVLILHPDDTYLLYLTDKKSLLLNNPQVSIFSDYELFPSIRKISQICPKKIAIDCRFVGKCSENWTFVGINVFAQPRLLETIEKNCHAKYKPTLCTGQLCIAESI